MNCWHCQTSKIVRTHLQAWPTAESRQAWQWREGVQWSYSLLFLRLSGFSKRFRSSCSLSRYISSVLKRLHCLSYGDVTASIFWSVKTIVTWTNDVDSP